MLRLAGALRLSSDYERAVFGESRSRFFGVGLTFQQFEN
jgi:hypothetical protein